MIDTIPLKGLIKVALPNRYAGERLTKYLPTTAEIQASYSKHVTISVCKLTICPEVLDLHQIVKRGLAGENVYSFQLNIAKWCSMCRLQAPGVVRGPLAGCSAAPSP